MEKSSCPCFWHSILASQDEIQDMHVLLALTNDKLCPAAPWGPASRSSLIRHLDCCYVAVYTNNLPEDASRISGKLLQKFAVAANDPTHMGCKASAVRK